MEWLTNVFYSLAPYFQFPEVLRYAVEIVVVTFVVYQLMILVRKTRAEQVLKGVIFLLFVYGLSLLLDLKTIVWVISNAIQFGVIALLIVFQPELRKALEQIGRGSRLWGRVALWREGDRPQQLVTALTRAMLALSREKTGALIVLEEKTGMNDIISTGVALDGLVTAELLVNIFEPNTPLHDGAVIIQGDRVAAAGCYLPLTENPNLSKQLGTRHRAALGLSEQSDALTFVVSEETGVISMARDGKLTRYLGEKGLTEILTERYTAEEEAKPQLFWNRWFRTDGKKKSE